MKKILLPTLIFTLSFPMLSCAASFDCTKAISATEKLICSDEKISALDEQMAASYKFGLEKATDKDAFKKTQVEWLKQQRTCKDEVCLTKAYEARLDVLQEKENILANQSQRVPLKPKYKFIPGPNGSQLQLCKDYLAFINRVPKNPEPNCGMDFTFDDIAKKQGFKEIPWTELDPKEYKDLIKNSYVYSVRNPNEQEVSSYSKEFEEFFDPKSIRLWTAIFDLNLDGKQDKVYRIKYRNCDSTASVFIARDDGVLDELTGARKISGNPFFYKGRAHVETVGVGEGFGLESYLNMRTICRVVTVD